MSLDAGFLTPTLFGFLLVLFRCTALCSVAPLFALKTVPMRARMGIALMLAFTAFSGAGFPVFALDRIWVRPRQAVVTVGVHATAVARVASDHLPLVAEIEIARA